MDYVIIIILLIISVYLIYICTTKKEPLMNINPSIFIGPGQDLRLDIKKNLIPTVNNVRDRIMDLLQNEISLLENNKLTENLNNINTRTWTYYDLQDFLKNYELQSQETIKDINKTMAPFGKEFLKVTDKYDPKQYIRDKVRTDLIPQMQFIQTFLDTMFSTQHNQLLANKLTRDANHVDVQRMVYLDILNLIKTQKEQFKSRCNDLIRQIESFVIQF